MIFSERDAGVPARIPIGTVLEFRLLEDPTTGCLWYAVTAASTLELVASLFEAVRPGAQQRRARELRGVGHRVFVLVALVPGVTSIRFDERCAAAIAPGVSGVPDERRLDFPLDVY